MDTGASIFTSNIYLTILIVIGAISLVVYLIFPAYSISGRINYFIPEKLAFLRNKQI